MGFHTYWHVELHAGRQIFGFESITHFLGRLSPNFGILHARVLLFFLMILGNINSPSCCSHSAVLTVAADRLCYGRAALYADSSSSPSLPRIEYSPACCGGEIRLQCHLREIHFLWGSIQVIMPNAKRQKTPLVSATPMDDRGNRAKRMPVAVQEAGHFLNADLPFLAPDKSDSPSENENSRAPKRSAVLPLLRVPQKPRATSGSRKRAGHSRSAKKK